MKIYVLIIMLLLSDITYATKQMPEEFVIDDARFEIETYPLEQHPDYEKIIKKIDPLTICTANWRGYKGRWHLRDDFLILAKLIKDACSRKPGYVNIKKLFNATSVPVKATWFSGDIRVRISARKYFSKKKDGFSGIEYEAIVYRFKSGKFISRSIETITERW